MGRTNSALKPVVCLRLVSAVQELDKAVTENEAYAEEVRQLFVKMKRLFSTDRNENKMEEGCRGFSLHFNVDDLHSWTKIASCIWVIAMD